MQCGRIKIPHQQQCRSNVVSCYQSNDSFDSRMTKSDVALTLLLVWTGLYTKTTITLAATELLIVGQ